jgi:hypothetical protein
MLYSNQSQGCEPYTILEGWREGTIWPITMSPLALDIKYKGFAYNNILESNTKDLLIKLFLDANTKDLLMKIFLEANTKDLLIILFRMHIQRICLWEYVGCKYKRLAYFSFNPLVIMIMSNCNLCMTGSSEW